MADHFILDEIDRRILLQLEGDADLANLELAARLHLSPATCLRRVKRLKKEGVIARVVALLEPSKVGMPLSAVVEITLDSQSAEKLAAFEAKAVAETAVRECYRIGSGIDFVLIVQLRDMQAYHALAHRLFGDDANVRNVRVLFATHRAKYDTRRLDELFLSGARPVAT